jgi:hypothetical protein
MLAQLWFKLRRFEWIVIASNFQQLIRLQESRYALSQFCVQFNFGTISHQTGMHVNEEQRGIPCLPSFLILTAKSTRTKLDDVVSLYIDLLIAEGHVAYDRCAMSRQWLRYSTSRTVFTN